MSPTGSSRWCPTPEQLMILEEMYRGGLRTPNATQIQQITAHLSYYGKIEGKNVFYWFQNHKARDRQKLRRKLSRQLMIQQQQQQFQQNHFLPQFPNCTTTPVWFLPQGGVEDVSRPMVSHSWNMDYHHPAERCEADKSTTRTYSRDWMMMMDHEGPTSPCCNRPLKTLELFPITATSLKDECTTSNHIPSSTSTN
ncbi:unnamed protein product [Camellia sinensis]